jgi:uncharacterized protein YecE (DUF72 family)
MSTFEEREKAGTDSLFPGGKGVSPAFSYDGARLAAKLSALAARGVYLGTSSWKYAGWLGQVYTEERYLTRGRFSQKKFESTCLGEYAETFPAVCGDFSFYQFPSGDYWRRLFGSAPSTLLYAFKAPEQVTVKVFPTHARYGARAGQPNETYLNAELLAEAFLRPLEPYRAQIATVIFEFGTFSRGNYSRLRDFLSDLDAFLSRVPPGIRYAVEVRNPELLRAEYFDCLRVRGAAHVFNSWTRMPALAGQTALPDAFTAGFTVARALLGRGRTYEQAVKEFEPYSEIKDPNEEARAALRAIITRSLDARQPAFIFVNNRLEGNAPGTIQALVE